MAEVNKVRKKRKLQALTAREDLNCETVFLEEWAKVLTVRGEIERLDRGIDVTVYKLYGLTWGKVRIIDPGFWVGGVGEQLPYRMNSYLLLDNLSFVASDV